MQLQQRIFVFLRVVRPSSTIFVRSISRTPFSFLQSALKDSALFPSYREAFHPDIPYSSSSVGDLADHRPHTGLDDSMKHVFFSGRTISYF